LANPENLFSLSRQPQFSPSFRPNINFGSNLNKGQSAKRRWTKASADGEMPRQDKRQSMSGISPAGK